jgi:NADH:ubiquinone oxidoreductase subunit D
MPDRRVVTRAFSKTAHCGCARGARLHRISPFPYGSFYSPLAAQQAVVALIEGWRGEICHVALTGPDGRFAAYKVVDPSFHNWSGLAFALRDQQVSDFPLCNKSFNLSYCGHDL